MGAGFNGVKWGICVRIAAVTRKSEIVTLLSKMYRIKPFQPIFTLFPGESPTGCQAKNIN